MSLHFQLDLDLTIPTIFPTPQPVDELPIHRPVENGEVFAIRNGETRYLTHHFHKFAGKFIPNVPRWAFQSISRGKHPKLCWILSSDQGRPLWRLCLTDRFHTEWTLILSLV